MLMLYNISMRTMVRQVKMHERSEDIMFKRILSAVLAASMITLPGAVTHAENEVVVDPDTVLWYDKPAFTDSEHSDWVHALPVGKMGGLEEWFMEELMSNVCSSMRHRYGQVVL